MIRSIASAFETHPATVGESYWEHFGFAGRTGIVLFKAAGAAIVHAVFPFWCEHTASETIIELHRTMTARRGLSDD